MKLIHVFSIAVFAVAPAAHAQSGHDHGHDASAQASQKADAQAHQAKGTVKSVNASKGTVTIAHGPVASLKWPGMTMAFKADKQILEQAKPGKEVQFVFQQRGKEYVITSLKPVS
jgi:Cu/Ag efflux protein CusF